MLVEEKKIEQRDGVYYEATYDSSNILQTTYFPHANLLYISFNRGGVYSYGNVDEEMYEKFKKAESQGKFFQEKIKSQPSKHPYRKEFTLYPEELKQAKEIVEESKKEDDEEEIMIHVGETEHDIYEVDPQGNPINTIEDNTIVFSIEAEEVIKITKDAFYWKGELVEHDWEIYDHFKEWLEVAREKEGL